MIGEKLAPLEDVIGGEERNDEREQLGCATVMRKGKPWSVM